MRYTGQGWEIPISLNADQALDPDPDTFQKRFEEDYTKLFGRPVAGMDIEITVWSVNATTPSEPAKMIDVSVGTEPAISVGTRQILDAGSGAFLSAKEIKRKEMRAGHMAEGPAAIVEDETTIILPKSRMAVCQPDGCIDVLRKG